MNPSTIGLAPEDFSTLMAILKRYVPGTEVWAFGSRVHGTARPFSDLDLVIINDQPLSLETRAELAYALSESNLPMKTDLIEWAKTTNSFRDIIRQKYLVLTEKAA